MSIYQKMTLQLLEQGELLATADVEFQKLQTNVLEHRRIYPKTKTKGKLTIEITLELSGKDEKLFIVTTQIKVSRPARPPSSTIALIDKDENGDGLFVGTAGSRKEDPRQRTFDDVQSDDGPGHDAGQDDPETPVAVDGDGNPL